MAKYIYPAIFTKEGDFYVVDFPDIESCYTQGNSLQEAFEMASDVLCMTLYNFEESKCVIPKPSDLKKVKANGDAFVSLVSCDTIEYRKLYDNKAIKKTLTIPSWLNTMAEREDVNFSAVLQSALKRELRL